MASDIGRRIATARRFMAVVQYVFLHLLESWLIVFFCNLECQMLNVGCNLTNVL